MRKVQEEIIADDSVKPRRVVRTTTIDEPTSTARDYNQKKAVFKTYQVIWYIFGLLEILLGFRVFLKLIAANPGSYFAAFIYNLSYIFVAPFSGIVSISVMPQGSILEWTTILAMIVYAVLAIILIYFLQLVKPTSPEEVEEVVDGT